MKTTLITAGLLGAVLVGMATSGSGQPPAKQPDPPAILEAVAVLHPTAKNDVRGVIRFVQKGEYVEITGELTGLKPGLHGFHVHEFGDCSAPDGKSAGDHFNPTNMPHGAPTDPKRHVGDLGNIKADEAGKAVVNMRDNVIKLNGPHSIIGRALVVHDGADDLKTQPSGDAGDQVACGVIGIANPKKPPK